MSIDRNSNALGGAIDSNNHLNNSKNEHSQKSSSSRLVNTPSFSTKQHTNLHSADPGMSSTTVPSTMPNDSFPSVKYRPVRASQRHGDALSQDQDRRSNTDKYSSKTSGEVRKQDSFPTTRQPPLSPKSSAHLNKPPYSPTYPRRSNTVTGSLPVHSPTSAANAEAAAAVVAQEMNAVQTLKRLSIGALPTIDPDLPNYSSDIYRTASDPTGHSSKGQVASYEPSRYKPNSRSSSNEFSFARNPVGDNSSKKKKTPEINASHASQLLWVPAHVHPELAPQEWKTFVQNKVAEIKAAVSESSLPSASSLSADNSSSGTSSNIRRRNSRLSRQIKDQESYTDGADILEKRKSRDALTDQLSDPTIESLSNQLKSLGELESLAMDPFQLARSLSLSSNLYSHSKTHDVSATDLSSSASQPPIAEGPQFDNDSPILPTPKSSLRRSTRTRYNKSSIRRGKRDIVQNRTNTLDSLDSPVQPALVSDIPSPQEGKRVDSSLRDEGHLHKPSSSETNIAVPSPDHSAHISIDDSSENNYDQVPQIIVSSHSDETSVINAPDISTPDSNDEPLQESSLPSPSSTSDLVESTATDHSNALKQISPSSSSSSSSSSSLSPSRSPSPSHTILSPTTASFPPFSKSTNTNQELDDMENGAASLHLNNSDLKERDGNISLSEDDDPQSKNKSRKGTWGWLFSGAAPTSQTINSQTPTNTADSRSYIVTGDNGVTPDTGKMGTANDPISISESEKASVDKFLNRAAPNSYSTKTTSQDSGETSYSGQSSKERLSNFFSKKKGSSSSKQKEQKQSEVVDQSDKKHLSADSVTKSRSRSPSPSREGRRSRSKSPNFRASKAEKKSGRYRTRSRTRSPENTKKLQEEETAGSITSGKSVVARPMPESSIVAYSAEAAAYYGAPYQIPPHQMSDKSLVMMHHRYPLHIERAIYRLSHLKLANPRRPLVQQVLLSNFMYAYLNLINQGFIQQQQQAQLQIQLQQQQQLQLQQQQQPQLQQRQKKRPSQGRPSQEKASPQQADYDSFSNSPSSSQKQEQISKLSDAANYSNRRHESSGEDDDTFYDTRETVS